MKFFVFIFLHYDGNDIRAFIRYAAKYILLLLNFERDTCGLGKNSFVHLFDSLHFIRWAKNFIIVSIMLTYFELRENFFEKVKSSA